jgi:pheromone a factor receptor
VIYGVLTVRTLRRRRRRFEDLLHHPADLNVNSNHYVRLICLAAVNIVAEVALNLYVFLLTVPSWNTNWIHSWKSWADTHRGFSHVGQFPVSVWRSWRRAAIAIDSARWICISSAFSFFCFFGFSKECMDQYRSVFMWLRTKTGFLPSSQPLITPLSQCVTSLPLSAHIFANLLLGQGLIMRRPQTSDRNFIRPRLEVGSSPCLNLR